ncbi:uncharacterized protein LOC142237873 [Haematobia irritans]|uniref:uncharacterized protein LOC142237873 n=1 Tax=Haematobia irritans TaxID=7368 RepID=UPI003F4F8E66
MDYPKLIGLMCIIIFEVNFSQGIRYKLFFDNPDLFESCPDEPDTNGIHDLFDITECKIHFNDGSIRVSGNVTCIWQDVQPTDRIELRFEVFKFQRGKWQLTPISGVVTDFCKSQFKDDTLWYTFWAQHVPVDERLCLNNIGEVYHHGTFDSDTTMDIPASIQGRHKVTVTFTAYDQLNAKRPNRICFEVIGDFEKL